MLDRSSGSDVVQASNVLRCPLNVFSSVYVLQYTHGQFVILENCIIAEFVGNAKFKLICSVSSL